LLQHTVWRHLSQKFCPLITRTERVAFNYKKMSLI
jgi:hypothetical protein